MWLYMGNACNSFKSTVIGKSQKQELQPKSSLSSSTSVVNIKSNIISLITYSKTSVKLNINHSTPMQPQITETFHSPFKHTHLIALLSIHKWNKFLWCFREVFCFLGFFWVGFSNVVLRATPLLEKQYHCEVQKSCEIKTGEEEGGTIDGGSTENVMQPNLPYEERKIENHRIALKMFSYTRKVAFKH